MQRGDHMRQREIFKARKVGPETGGLAWAGAGVGLGEELDRGGEPGQSRPLELRTAMDVGARAHLDSAGVRGSVDVGGERNNGYAIGCMEPCAFSLAMVVAAASSL